MGTNRVWIASAFATLLLITCACTPSMARLADAPGYVLLWRVDELLVTQAGTSGVRPIRSRIPLKNIVDVNGSRDALTVISFSDTGISLAVRLIDLRSGNVISQVASNAARADVDHGRGRLAFTRYASSNDGTYDIMIADVATGAVNLLAPRIAGPTSCLSWNRLTGSLAFDADDETYEWTGGSPVHLLKGTCPSWSPDGKLIVFRRGPKSIYVYDAATREVTELYRRRATETTLVGPMFWSPDQRYVAVTVHSGAGGYGKQCLAIDTLTKRAALIHEGYAFCGPWLAEPPS